MAPVVGYWAIRGLAQPIRLMLKYCGVEFEEKRYLPKDDPSFNADKDQDWFDVKFTFGLDFPNIPYYIDGDVKLTQTTAILRYLARKHNMYGSNDDDRALADVVSAHVMDIRNLVITLVYHPTSQQDYDEKKKIYDEELPAKLKLFEEFMGNKQWLIGDQLTYVDFQWYEILDQHVRMCPGCLENFPKLQAYHERFEKLPAIKSYMESSDFIRSPINGSVAYFIG